MRRNVIIILADCIRADYLYDDSSLYIPTVNHLKTDGVVFENVITSAPWTNPSLSALFTGIYSHKLDLYKYRGGFPDDVKLLQEYFKEAGYKVASFFATRGLFSGDRICEQGTTRDTIKILDWIEANHNNPFFVFLHYWQTHPPYFYRYSKKAWYAGKDSIVKLLQEPSGRQKVVDLYKHAIERFSEEFVYSLVEKLNDLEIIDNTFLIITADHGESFGDRYKDPGEIDLFSMHGKSLYQEVLRVPLIYVGPDIPGAKHITTQVRSIDTAATLLDLLGMEEDSRFRKMDGKSLKAVWEDKEQENRLAFSSTTYALYPPDKEASQAFSLFAAVDGIWKVVYDRKENKWAGYNLADDPNENRPLSTEEHEALKRLREQLAEEIPGKEISAEEQKILRRHLQNLGYL